jgi:hypothetical protein
VSKCHTCAGTGWVCENHRDLPWQDILGVETCGCGAGAPCGSCNLAMASASYSEPWRELALAAIEIVADAVRETSWGQPTFGPDAEEELRARYDATLAREQGA